MLGVLGTLWLACAGCGGWLGSGAAVSLWGCESHPRRSPTLGLLNLMSIRIPCLPCLPLLPSAPSFQLRLAVGVARCTLQVESLFAGRASLTTAIPGMLEVLPLGASKGEGVSWLLDRLGVDPAACLALGDGENDVEMLQLCGLGVAMGNAGPPALAVADAVTATNNEDGVARAVERFVLAPRGLAVPVAAAGTAGV